MTQDKISFSRTVDGGIKISKEEVFSIFSLMGDLFGSKPEMSVGLADGIEIKSYDIEGVFADPSLRANKIEWISISVYKHEDSKYANFKIKNESFNPLHYGCTGSRNDCDQFRQRMGDEIKSVLTGYSFIYKYEVFSWILILLLLAPPIFLYVVKDVKSEVLIIVLLFASMCNALFIGAILRKFVFPRVVFNFGKSAKINELRVKMISFIFYGVFITIILAVIGNYISSKII